MVRLETKVADNQLIIKVSDNGCGIPPEHLSKIFNLYFTTKLDGTGMGLSMAHQIVSEHGGRIEVESEVGKGTTFTITLPLQQPQRV
jgi:signal transduction histidine kinase